MWEFTVNHQLNIMLGLSGVCGVLALLIVLAKALTKKRRIVLVLMELTAMFLVSFDRLAYIYAGRGDATAYVMVRLSNFIVFLMTSGMVFAFNLYVSDLLQNEGKMKILPKRLDVTLWMSVAGMLLIIISQFTHIIYSIDENNVYHREPLFLLCYIVPVIAPLIQLSVILQYKKHFNMIIFISLVLFITVPIVAAIIQIFAYGLSLVNTAMVLVAITLYIFAYFDINDSVERAHRAEISGLDEERRNLRELFEETATALADATEDRDIYRKGRSVRVAKRAEMIAQKAGKDPSYCYAVYHAALLQDVGLSGFSDEEMEKYDLYGAEDQEIIKKKSITGGVILSNITRFPELRIPAMYSNEQYDGTGFPDGRKGEEIPEIARIVSVADAYEEMDSKKKNRDPFPPAMIREEFVKEAGSKYDPDFARIMVEIMDDEAKKG
ncbi:MAG: HD domain-containing protein, partial [Lachnospiraceae bacterium]|nr:HD domain-containing protein [Lachnospiraceae bacterium]